MCWLGSNLVLVLLLTSLTCAAPQGGLRYAGHLDIDDQLDLTELRPVILPDQDLSVLGPTSQAIHFLSPLATQGSTLESDVSARYASNSCAPGHIRRHDGTCFRPNVRSKKLFLYNVPKQSRKIITQATKVKDPTLDLNLVFLRLPRQLVHNRKHIVVPPPQQKTAVYVLQENFASPSQEVVQLPFRPSKPDVYFVNYGSGENPELPGGISLESALQTTIHKGLLIGGSSGEGHSGYGSSDNGGNEAGDDTGNNAENETEGEVEGNAGDDTEATGGDDVGIDIRSGIESAVETVDIEVEGENRAGVADEEGLAVEVSVQETEVGETVVGPEADVLVEVEMESGIASSLGKSLDFVTTGVVTKKTDEVFLSAGNIGKQLDGSAITGSTDGVEIISLVPVTIADQDVINVGGSDNVVSDTVGEVATEVDVGGAEGGDGAGEDATALEGDNGGGVGDDVGTARSLSGDIGGDEGSIGGDDGGIGGDDGVIGGDDGGIGGDDGGIGGDDGGIGGDDGGIGGDDGGIGGDDGGIGGDDGGIGGDDGGIGGDDGGNGGDDGGIGDDDGGLIRNFVNVRGNDDDRSSSLDGATITVGVPINIGYEGSPSTGYDAPPARGYSWDPYFTNHRNSFSRDYGSHHLPSYTNNSPKNSGSHHLPSYTNNSPKNSGSHYLPTYTNHSPQNSGSHHFPSYKNNSPKNSGSHYLPSYRNHSPKNSGSHYLPSYTNHSPQNSGSHHFPSYTNNSPKNSGSHHLPSYKNHSPKNSHTIRYSFVVPNSRGHSRPSYSRGYGIPELNHRDSSFSNDYKTSSLNEFRPQHQYSHGDLSYNHGSSGFRGYKTPSIPSYTAPNFSDYGFSNLKGYTDDYEGQVNFAYESPPSYKNVGKSFGNTGGLNIEYGQKTSIKDFATNFGIDVSGFQSNEGNFENPYLSYFRGISGESNGYLPVFGKTSGGDDDILVRGIGGAVGDDGFGVGGDEVGVGDDGFGVGGDGFGVGRDGAGGDDGGAGGDDGGGVGGDDGSVGGDDGGTGGDDGGAGGDDGGAGGDDGGVGGDDGGAGGDDGGAGGDDGGAGGDDGGAGDDGGNLNLADIIRANPIILSGETSKDGIINTGVGTKLEESNIESGFIPIRFAGSNYRAAYRSNNIAPFNRGLSTAFRVFPNIRGRLLPGRRQSGRNSAESSSSREITGGSSASVEISGESSTSVEISGGSSTSVETFGSSSTSVETSGESSTSVEISGGLSASAENGIGASSGSFEGDISSFLRNIAGTRVRQNNFRPAVPVRIGRTRVSQSNFGRTLGNSKRLQSNFGRLGGGISTSFRPPAKFIGSPNLVRHVPQFSQFSRGFVGRPLINSSFRTKTFSRRSSNSENATSLPDAQSITPGIRRILSQGQKS